MVAFPEFSEVHFLVVLRLSGDPRKQHPIEPPQLLCFLPLSGAATPIEEPFEPVQKRHWLRGMRSGFCLRFPQIHAFRHISDYL